MPEICSQIRALVRGLPRYFTGIPCKYGHVVERYTADRRCVDCAANHGRKSYYGLELGQFEVIMERQDGKCVCCKRPFTKTRKPHVDHNHRTGNVRGILCQSCNRNISGFDSPLREVYAAYVDNDGDVE